MTSQRSKSETKIVNKESNFLFDKQIKNEHKLSNVLNRKMSENPKNQLWSIIDQNEEESFTQIKKYTKSFKNIENKENTHFVASEKIQKCEKVEKIEILGKPEKIETLNNLEKTEKPEKQEKTDKTDKTIKTDTKDKPEETKNDLNQSICDISILMNSPVIYKNEDNYEHSKPTLSIPKIVPQKNISLKSPSHTPDSIHPHIKFSFNLQSPIATKATFSLLTSESEGTEHSLINPLITPPDKQKLSNLNFLKLTKTIKKTNNSKENIGSLKLRNQSNNPGSSKRYNCLSPDSYEESEDSVLVTVQMPDESDQYLRIHKDDNLKSIMLNFGKQHNLDSEQIKTLEKEVFRNYNYK